MNLFVHFASVSRVREGEWVSTFCHCIFSWSELCYYELGARSGISDECNVSESFGLKGRDDIAVMQGLESLTENSVTNKIEHV